MEWQSVTVSVQSPSHHHTVCSGRETINITSNKLILNGAQPTKLILTPNYSWIDDCAIFNNIKTNTKHTIETSFIIRMMWLMSAPTTTNSISQSIQHSTKSAITSTAQPTLSSTYHVASFDTCTISQNPLSMRSNLSTTTVHSINSNILPTPQGYVAMICKHCVTD